MNALLYKRIISATVCIFFYFIGFMEANVCPSKEDMNPCECSSQTGYHFVSCNDIFNSEELLPPMKAIEKMKTVIILLTIENSSMLYLPENLFRKTIIKKVYLFNSGIGSLAETDHAFIGLEETLREIYAINVTLLTDWNFEQLRNLQLLRLVYLQHTPLNFIDPPFPYLPELMVLRIDDAEISYIIDDAFSNLPKLTLLDMEDNKITEMKRSMFPNPANSLSVINLSKNMLSSLPYDFFDDMPSLTQVSLEDNQFITLSEKPFSIPLEKDMHLLMTGNPLRCDCRLRWILSITDSHALEGQCSKPNSLLGRKINALDMRSLRC